MDNSHSSGGSSHSNSTQHAALLATVMELKGDLERTMSKMSVMDQQNRSLTHNYNIVKDELIETRKKYNECRENYLNTVNERVEEEGKTEAFLDNLKTQLTEKTKEFETLRDKFAPQDIDFIRIKVQEELEIPHKQRLTAMEAEVQKHKENYFSLRRELEASKAEYETYSQNQQREVQAIRDENDSVVCILREQMVSLELYRGAITLYWWHLVYVQWCIRQLSYPSVISHYITSIAHDQYTDIYSQTYIFISTYRPNCKNRTKWPRETTS